MTKQSNAPKQSEAPKAPSMEIIEGAGPQMLTDMNAVQGTNPERDPEVAEVEQHGLTMTVIRA